MSTQEFELPPLETVTTLPPLTTSGSVTTLVVPVAGPTGPIGPAGPAGSNGAEGAAGAYLHSQQGASSVWDIEHRLGFDPAAAYVTDVGGEQWLPLSVIYINSGQAMRLSFTDAIAGTARIS